jgi:STIP1 homology and U-box containing protein 1
MRERDRLRRRSNLLREFEEKVEQDTKKEVADIEARLMASEIGKVAAEEDTQQLQDETKKKLEEIRTVFAIADPKNLAKRVGRRTALWGIT